MSHRPWAAVICASLILVSSCGDSDSEGDGNAHGVSAKQFQERINEGCDRRNAEGERLIEDFPDEPSPEDMQNFARFLVPMFQELLADLRSVGPPEGEQDTFEAYLGQVEASLADWERSAADPEAARDVFQQESGGSSEARAVDIERLERALGLEQCAASY